VRAGVRNYPPASLADEVGRPHGPVLRRDVLTFSIGGEEYALGIEAIREIIKNRPVTEVPRVPPFVAGIVAVRGVVMPVIDMRMRLRLPAPAISEKARILVVTHPGGGGDDNSSRDPFGLLVDRVHHVVRLYEQDVEPPTMLAGHEVDFVAGIGRVQRIEGTDPRGRQGGMLPQRQRHMLILLDLERVLTFEHAGSALHAAHTVLDRGELRALAAKEKTP
jgi:chemotaxis signal transduction protein